MHSIETQFRGLLHFHLLLRLLKYARHCADVLAYLSIDHADMVLPQEQMQHYCLLARCGRSMHEFWKKCFKWFPKAVRNSAAMVGGFFEFARQPGDQQYGVSHNKRKLDDWGGHLNWCFSLGSSLGWYLFKYGFKPNDGVSHVQPATTSGASGVGGVATPEKTKRESKRAIISPAAWAYLMNIPIYSVELFGGGKIVTYSLSRQYRVRWEQVNHDSNTKEKIDYLQIYEAVNWGGNVLRRSRHHKDIC